MVGKGTDLWVLSVVADAYDGDFGVLHHGDDFLGRGGGREGGREGETVREREGESEGERERGRMKE